MRAPAAIRQHRRKQRRARNIEREHYWKLIVTRGGCVMCKPRPPLVDSTLLPDLRAIEGHHIITQQHLRNLGFEHADIWDERNGIALCAYHHHRHHRHKERLPRRLLPDGIFEFAATHRIEWLLDREYPNDN